jgi:hypothetical protein
MSNAVVLSPARSFRSSVRRVIRSPGFEIALGLVVLGIGVVELLEEAFALLIPSPDVHHALILLGAVISLRGLLDISKGIELVAEGELRAQKAHGEGVPHNASD